MGSLILNTLVNAEAVSPDGKAKFQLEFKMSEQYGFAECLVTDMSMDGDAEELQFDIKKEGIVYAAGPGGTDVDVAKIPDIAGVRVDLFKNVKKTYPNVRKITVGENVHEIRIRNEAFPNVREVASRSPYIKSGNCLMRYQPGGLALYNTFCKGPGEEIDLAGVCSVKAGAFNGCKSANVVNAENVAECGDDGHGYYPEDGDGCVAVGRTLLKARAKDGIVDIPPHVEAAASSYTFAGLGNAKVRFSSVGSIDVMRMYYGTAKLSFLMDFRDGELWGNEFFGSRYISSNEVDIEVAKADTRYKAADNIVYSKDGKTLFRCMPCNSPRDIVIPEGVECIRADAFNNVSLRSISFPKTLRTVQAGAVYGIGLKDVLLPEGVLSVGRMNFCEAESIRQESQKPIMGLLNCIFFSHQYAENKPLKIVVGGKTIVLPPGTKHDSTTALSAMWDFGFIVPELAESAYELAKDPEIAQDTALEALWINQGNNKAREYLKAKANGMAGRYCKKKDSGRLMQMAALGLVKPQKAGKIVEAGAEWLGSDAKSYLLAAAGGQMA